MAGKHAILAPSSASQWLVCHPSARYQMDFPDEESQFAAEGTLAHSLGELLIRLKIGMITKQKYEVQLKKIKRDPLYDASMQGHCEDYASFAVESYHNASRFTPLRTAEILIEQRLDLTTYVPESFGTSDCIIHNGHRLTLIDLKYGKGVEVSAEGNSQLKIYALGALEHIKDPLISVITLVIYQPRLDNISTWEIQVDDLINWGRDTLVPAAVIAFKGGGEFIAGKHCQFCKGKAVCRANAKMNMEIAKYDFAMPPTLDLEEITDILDRATPLTSWLKSIKDYALTKAKAGTKFPHYKLVNGRSDRSYVDEEKITSKLVALGYKKEDIIKTGLCGITSLEKIVSQADFNDHLSTLIIKPTGAPTLVPESDKRHAISSAASAAADFADDELEDLESFL